MATAIVSVGDRFATSFGVFTVTAVDPSAELAITGQFKNGTVSLFRADGVASMVASDIWTKLPAAIALPANRRLFA